MTYGTFLIGHHLFWSALAGASLGGALATATRDARRERRPDRARSRKWTAAALWTTIAVLAATGAILVADGRAFLSLPSLYVGAGALVFFALALRFPRSGGIPAFFILAALAVLGPLLMRPFVPVRDTGVAATVQLLAVDQSGAYLEIKDRTPDAGRAPQVVTMKTETVIARTHVLHVSDYLFFLGAGGGIALETLRAEGAASPDGAPGTLYPGMQFIERAIDVMPLLTLTTAESAPVRLNLLQEYEIVGLTDGSIQIRAVEIPE